ncbi:hypothetical protein GT347_19655 [Xylophilus rhododendri]|uniref:Uncharacterized protein n=1 Tax=Xylophilus rhododendri TaxID=2697032 RepID=A0A857J7I9_9BURK|nr:hypothetical protein [Xylophilus rhododendri]QHJ00001.1 hypothetical protein GT347_19655 [Xylophilus rhododendri]
MSDISPLFTPSQGLAAVLKSAAPEPATAVSHPASSAATHRVTSPEIQDLIQKLTRPPVRMRPRLVAVARAPAGKPRSPAHHAEESVVDEGFFGDTGKTSAIGGKGQSGHSDQSGSQQQDSHGGHPDGASAPAGVEAGFDISRSASPSTENGHLARACADLPERCARHCQAHGIQAMPAFLRETMGKLLPEFLQDLAERLAAQLRTREDGGPLDLVGPIRTVCEDLQNRMRPLHATYGLQHYLLSDVRETLCSAEDPLDRKVQDHEPAVPLLRQLLGDSVYLLLPVLFMACVARPPQTVLEPTGDAA